MKKVSIIILAAAFYSNIINLTFAAEEKAPPREPTRPSFAMIFGSISKIDMKDPAKVVLEVKSDVDNKIHTIEITPWTNVTKVTDISELRIGDTVRIMTKDLEDKDVAITVMFGKIKNIPTPMPATQDKAPVWQQSPIKQK